MQAFALFMISAGIYFSALFINNILDSKNGFDYVIPLLISIIATIGLIHTELDIYIGIIRIESNGIRTKGDIRFQKLQYPAHVLFEDIASMSIEPFRGSSNGEKIALLRPNPYLIIKKKNGRIIRFSLHVMSKRNVKKMLLCIKERAALYNSDLEIDVPKLLSDFNEARFAL